MLKFIYNLATDKYNGFIFFPFKVFLSLLSLLYGLVVRALIFLRQIKPQHLNCKVISVGNITLGGTGKTILVEFIAKYLKGQGHKVAILTRGYKRKGTGYRVQGTGYEEMGDEPYMLSKKLGDIPVIVNKDRVRGASQAIKDYGVDTVILDDGFQQWGIRKDLEVVCIDAINPFGNKHLIPRGILREDLSSLKRADLYILTKTDLNPYYEEAKKFLASIKASALILESRHKPTDLCGLSNHKEAMSVESLRDKQVTLFSGIGDPGSFEILIFNLGMHIGASFRFPDHHNYRQGDLDKIITASKAKDIDTIITTEKDAVRLSAIRYPLSAIRILALRIELEIKNEQILYHRLDQLYSF